MLHQGATTIQDAFDLFLLDIQARGLAASTLIFYKVKVAPFLRWCEDQQLEQLNCNQDENSSFSSYRTVL